MTDNTPLSGPSVQQASGEESTTPAVRSDWQAAVQRIRDTANWITKVFTAIAALLIGTGPLLVDLTNLRLGPAAVIGGAGAAVALIGIGIVIRWSTEVMLPETTDLAELASAQSGALHALRSHVQSPIGRRIYLDRDVADIDGLIDAMESWQRTVELMTRYAQQVAIFESQDPRPAETALPQSLRDASARASVATTLAGAKARLRQLNLRATELVKHGVYVEVRSTFIKARRIMLAGGALTAVGVAIYVAALGAPVGDEAGSKQPGGSATPIATLSWNRTASPDARPITEVRETLGLADRLCDTVPVIVRSGTGGGDAPWQLTTLRVGPCNVSPREFTIDSRYATIISEPALKIRLDPSSDHSWLPPVVGFAVGSCLVGGLLALSKLRRRF